MAKKNIGIYANIRSEPMGICIQVFRVVLSFIITHLVFSFVLLKVECYFIAMAGMGENEKGYFAIWFGGCFQILLVVFIFN